MHASDQQQSWFGKYKALGIASATTTVLGTGFMGLCLWAWNDHKKESQKLTDARSKKSELEAEQTELGAILEANTRLHNNHMNREPWKNGAIFMGLEGKKPKNVKIAPQVNALKDYGTTHQPATCSDRECAAASSAASTGFSTTANKQRKNACPVFKAAHDGLNKAVQPRKDVVDEQLRIAKTDPAHLEDRSIRLKRSALIGGTITVVSLATFVWNKNKA